MAKCSAHGAEVGTAFFTTSAKRYFSDGVILKNSGFGWKVAGKVKDGITPQQAFQHQMEKTRDFLAKRPALAAYRKMLHATAGMCNRWKLDAAIQLMPDDADGVWSEACDGYGDNVSADIDEVSELCAAFRAALAEQVELKQELATA